VSDNTQLSGSNISGFQNFVKDLPFVVSNLGVMENGQVCVRIQNDLSCFSTLFVIAQDFDAHSTVVLDVDALCKECEEEGKEGEGQRSEIQSIKTRDLRLTKTFDLEKNWVEVRKIHPLFKHDVFKFDASVNSFSNIQIVDSLKQVFQIFREWSAPLAKFEFITRWDGFSLKEKNIWFDQFYSFELCFFIQKKDPLYFQETVIPFIESKLEKQFFDFYLLDDQQKVKEHFDHQESTLYLILLF
jgi:hypothetical protein